MSYNTICALISTSQDSASRVPSDLPHKPQMRISLENLLLSIITNSYLILVNCEIRHVLGQSSSLIQTHISYMYTFSIPGSAMN